MAQQEGGWPLGLQPLNLRIDLVRNVDFSGSLSLSTLITTSPTSSYSSSSSELGTEFAGSFFRDRRITLGSLIGIASLFDLSNRSLRRRSENSSRIKKKSNGGNNRAAKHWFSSLCTKAQLSGEVTSSAPSLGHFLEAERRASDGHRTSRRTDVVAIAYELEELAPGRHSGSEPNSLFSDGRILPPASNRDVGVGKANMELNSSQSGISEAFWGLRGIHCFALLSPCMSGHVAE